MNKHKQKLVRDPLSQLVHCPLHFHLRHWILMLINSNNIFAFLLQFQFHFVFNFITLTPVSWSFVSTNTTPLTTVLQFSIASQVESSVQTSVLCRRWEGAMTIPVLSTTGKLVHGDNASRTLSFHQPTHLWAVLVEMMSPVLWGCKPAKSFVSGWMWARFLPKSKKT